MNTLPNAAPTSVRIPDGRLLSDSRGSEPAVSFDFLILIGLLGLVPWLCLLVTVIA